MSLESQHKATSEEWGEGIQPLVEEELSHDCDWSGFL
jgi:hypothetical protein